VQHEQPSEELKEDLAEQVVDDRKPHDEEETAPKRIVPSVTIAYSAVTAPT
jgi:hypothetical protein